MDIFSNGVLCDGFVGVANYLSEQIKIKTDSGRARGGGDAFDSSF